MNGAPGAFPSGATLAFLSAISWAHTRFFPFSLFLFSGLFFFEVPGRKRMQILQPIKLKSTGRVLGNFYRLREDGKLQYISFKSTIVTIEADKVEPASKFEYEADRERRYARAHNQLHEED